MCLIWLDFGACRDDFPARLLCGNKGRVLRRRVAHRQGSVAAQSLGGLRIFHGDGGGSSNFVDGDLRHVGWGVQAVPLGHLKTGVAALSHSGYVRQLGKPLFGAGGNAAQLA